MERVDNTGRWKRCIFFSSDPIKNWIKDDVRTIDDMYPYGKLKVPNYEKCADIANDAIDKMMRY